MFDSRKIDSFFDGDKPFENMPTDGKAPMSKGLRFVKLGFPCLAALLLGLMVVVPSVKKNVDLQDRTTFPRKEELEKLHMEDTVFHFTDGNNRVSEVIAENIDETEPGSNKVKIMHPKGYITTANGKVNIISETGYFNQKENILDLQNNVRVTANGNTLITTSSATYEFNRDYGYGNETVHATGDWGTLEAKSFTYDKNQELLTLIGQNKLTSKNGTLTATEKTELYRNESKVYAYGEATVLQDKTMLTADKIIGFFTADNKHELRRVEAYGNVVIKADGRTARGQKGFYEVQTGKVELFGTAELGSKTGGMVEVREKDNLLHAGKIEAYLSNDTERQLQKVNAYGNVRVQTPKGTARGNRGVYNPQKNIVELFDNVIIEQDGNFIKGTHAETDLNTSISRIRSDKTTGGRISGTFYKKKGK